MYFHNITLVINRKRSLRNYPTQEYPIYYINFKIQPVSKVEIEFYLNLLITVCFYSYYLSTFTTASGFYYDYIKLAE